MRPALWFYDHGIGIFPIVTPGKKPACASWDDFRCTRVQAARLRNYGVRLGRCHRGWLVVLDTDSPASETWVSAHLPATSFIVRTARGWHRYYIASGPLPAYIHRDGCTIECRNQGQYVVGPGSIHPGDPRIGLAPGTVYTANEWSWQWGDIARFPTGFTFDDRPPEACGSGDGQPFTLPAMVCAGERHDVMFRLLRSLQARGVDDEAALAVCQIENRAKCRPPMDADVLDRYLRRVARQRDRLDFIRVQQLAWDLCHSLLGIRLSYEAIVAACRSVDPNFDPMNPEPSLEPDAPAAEWDLDSPEGSI